MRKIWNYLKAHASEDFQRGHYISILLLLSVAIPLNYWFDFEDSILDNLPVHKRLPGFFLTFGTLYYLSVLSYAHWYRRKDIFRQRDFWISSLTGLFLLSLDSSVPFLAPMIDSIFVPELQLWTFKIAVNLTSFITVFFPLLIFYFFIEKYDDSTYGLTPKRFDFRPYVTMLLIMLPLLLVVSLLPSFLLQYPMYTKSPASAYLGVSEWVTVAGYELAYGLDFITVEFLFRGFFVIGMMSFLGRGSVLTMAVIYCALHFGKPAGEAISSIAGGYILGVIAYETKSVWGGIIVHVGIAWSMELFAFLQKL